ncbi:hypothetical protein Lal_00008973 [Lupinus albus]|nr:hypothetical protein Lal_00008973 [Lupinus albus]
MKITVLGCGALGQLWLTALCKHGHEVQGWLRVPQPYCSVNLIGEDGSIFNESLTANDPDFLAQSDLLLVTLKAWQVSDAVKTLAAQLPPTSPILLLHNGMGTLDELKSVPQPLLMATTTHAARRDGNIIVHVASGVTHIGPARTQDGDYSYLADVLQKVLPDVAWHNHIRPQLWRKLAVNCVINPLTALWNCPNGELKNHPQEVAALCAEVAAVVEREGLHTSADDLRCYVEQVIESTAENISSMLQDVRALRHTEIDYITGYLLKRARAHGIAVPENARLEEMEAVTTIDLMVRGGIKVTTASVASDGNLAITCSRGVKILADAPLVQVADGDYDIIVLPGGLKGAECFRDSPLLVETVRQFHLSGRIVAAICAAAGTVLVPHDIFPIGNMTGFPGLKDTIPEDQWVDKRVVWDPRVNLLTSQGPGTAIDFGLKIIDLLVGREKAYEVASSLVMPAGIYNYYEE